MDCLGTGPRIQCPSDAQRFGVTLRDLCGTFRKGQPTCRAAALPPLTWIAFPAFPRLRHRTETEEFELMLMRWIWALRRVLVKCAQRSTMKRMPGLISSR